MLEYAVDFDFLSVSLDIAVRTPPCAAGARDLAKVGKLAKSCKFLAGSFSAVSKRNFARKYAVDSIFQDLQDLYAARKKKPALRWAFFS